MATLVCRFETRAELGGALHRHVIGETRADTAVQREGLEAVEVLEDDLEAGREALARAVMPARGRRPRPTVDMLIAGPPAFEGDPDKPEQPWALERIRVWAREVVVAVREGLGPRSVVTAAALHLDERSPHVHVQAVPIDAQGRLGWSHVRAAWAGVTGRSKEAAGQAASRIQDAMWERLGAPYGLERGEVGSKRRHRAVDRLAGVEDRLRTKEEALQEAQERLQEVEAAVRCVRAELAELRLEAKKARGEGQRERGGNSVK